MAGLSEDLVNRSLDACGLSDMQIGSLHEGTRAAQVALRHYVPCLVQLLRAALWNFARVQNPMTLLGASPGYSIQPQNQQVGTLVIPPWTYEYAWPDDCVAARFVPWNNQANATQGIPGNISIAPQPQTTFSLPFQTPPILMPARMLISTDPNYPYPSGPSGPVPEWWNIAGVSPTMRKVILCDVPCAELVYTAFIEYPSMWDALFEEAFVALLATHLSLPLNPDKKEGRAIRGEQIAIAKAAIGEARVRDGDEGWPTAEHIPDWIRGRNIGAGADGWGGMGGWGFGTGPGVWGYGWGSVLFGDGSAY
jgi:hypothetical protein